jgi:uncharacterized integral membrane protein
MAVAVLAPLVLAVLFAAYNRPQPIHLDLGFWAGRVEAVHAVFGGTVVGLLVMFLLGLPADLHARAERRRLAGRVRALERELETERMARRNSSRES